MRRAKGNLPVAAVAGRTPPLEVAYLASRFPTVSQTFITREVEALRRRGAVVTTFGIWPAPDSEVLAAADERARATTYYLLASRGRVLRAVRATGHLRGVSPLAALRLAWRHGRGARGKLWQFFYLIEALILHAECDRRGLSHVHVHFANNAADVARLAVALGRARGRGLRTWSFTMHGPTEFADVEKFDLSGKARDAELVVAISEYARSQVLALLPVEQWPKVEVVRCGLRLDEWPPMERPAQDQALRILCVGRLVPEKGQAILLQAVRLLLDAGVAAEVSLVGDGPQRPALEVLVDELGLRAHVKLVGAVGQDHIRAWFAWATVFCLPSFAEGLPVVLMEAMASGLPVVTTRIAGIPELVRHGRNGLVVTPGSPTALADGLRELTSSKRREQFAAVAGDDVRRRHDVDVEAALLHDVLRRGLSAGGPGGRVVRSA